MSTEQLTAEALSLPLPGRVALAQTLWESINSGLPEMSERDAVREAVQRDRELSSGAVVRRPHDQVMAAARRAIGCD